VIYGINILSTNANYFIKPESAGAMDQLAEIILREGILISGHNLKEDYYALMANGILDVPAAAKAGAVFNTEFDTVIAQYVLDPSRSDYGLKTMMLEYFHEDLRDENKLSLRSKVRLVFLTSRIRNSWNTARNGVPPVEKLTGVLKNKLTNENLETVYYEVEHTSD
jgi:DNA polymerase-1